MNSFAEQIHHSWTSSLPQSVQMLDSIEERLSGASYSPSKELVMRAFTGDLNDAKVVIFGQDPYPSSDHTTGFAFAIPKEAKKIPASLRNILHEAKADVGASRDRTQDLSLWIRQGVLLINRTLTISDNVSNSHKDLGWSDFTDCVAKTLGNRGVVPILWGKSAQELGKYFPPDRTVESVHPSPLSAYRGFFGSKPFSRANEILVASGKSPINW